MKTGLWIGMVILAGCASKPHESALPLSDFGMMQKEAAEGPYKVGKSTEDELIAVKGTPLSRTVANDGAREDVYQSFFTYTVGSGSSKKLVHAPTPKGMPDFKIHYLYSADGILRGVKAEMIANGANGPGQTTMVDVTNGSPIITPLGNRDVKSGS